MYLPCGRILSLLVRSRAHTRFRTCSMTKGDTSRFVTRSSELSRASSCGSLRHRRAILRCRGAADATETEESPLALQPIEDMLRKLGQALDSRRTATLMRRRTRRTWVRSAPRSLHRAQRTADKPKLYEKKVAAGAASPTSKGEAHERSHCRGADGAE